MCEQSLCKIDYKGMNTAGVTDYTTPPPPPPPPQSISDGKNV